MWNLTLSSRKHINKPKKRERERETNPSPRLSALFRALREKKHQTHLYANSAQREEGKGSGPKFPGRRTRVSSNPLWACAETHVSRLAKLHDFCGGLSFWWKLLPLRLPSSEQVRGSGRGGRGEGWGPSWSLAQNCVESVILRSGKASQGKFTMKNSVPKLYLEEEHRYLCHAIWGKIKGIFVDVSCRDWYSNQWILAGESGTISGRTTIWFSWVL